MGGRRIAIPTAALLAITLSAVVAAPSSGARPCEDVVPPGNSQVDQYSETVPKDCGDGPIRRQPQPGTDSVAQDTVEELNALGPAGEATAELALANSLAPRRNGAPAKGGDAGPGPKPGAATSALTQSEGSALDAILGLVGLESGSADEGDEGMGALLPIALLLAVAAGVAYLLVRRRRG